MSKTKEAAYTQIENTLAIAGSALVILSCVAGIYYAYVNQRFIHDPFLDLLYYLNYLVPLGGGFAVGYLLHRKGKTKLFSGAAYALLTVSIYFLLELIRIMVHSWFGMLPFPWERIVFEGNPLFSLVITIIIAVSARRMVKQADFSRGVKWIFIITFLITQLYYFISGLYLTVADSSSSSSYATPMWLVVGSYLVNPIVVILFTYILLRRVKSSFQRLFYSVFVGSFCYVFLLVLWNFSNDPSLNATNAFEATSIIAVLIATSILLWRMGLAVRHS